MGKDILDLVARICLSAIFLFEAYTSIKFKSRTQETMLEYGFTWQPELLIYITAFALALGGIFLLIGYRPKFAVILLLIYWIPVTLAVYKFWDAPPGRHNIQSIMFMKNVAIIGGLLMVYIHGTGTFSVRRFFGVPIGPKEKW